MNTKARQAKIQELLKKEPITDQNQLVALLKEQYGLETNQTVISRDLLKLGVVKRMRNGVRVYEMPTLDVQEEILKLALISIEHNESMIVIKTQPALADFVGDCLDMHMDLEILGCLAGENVVFAVPKSVKNIAQVCNSIREKFNFTRNADV